MQKKKRIKEDSNSKRKILFTFFQHLLHILIRDKNKNNSGIRFLLLTNCQKIPITYIYKYFLCTTKKK